MTAGLMRSAEDFLTAAALQTRDVPLPGGGSVRVRELSVLQRSEFRNRSKEDPHAAGAWIVEQCCLDERGFRLFADGQVGELMVSSPRIVEHVSLAILQLSGLIGGTGGNG